MYLKTFESGLIPIPIQRNSKAPVSLAKGFNKWNTDGVSEQLITRFENEYPINQGYGIGIVCGPGSNIVVVDIDTDAKEILDLCPPSPCRRRGKKGEARFFKYSPLIQNHTLSGVDSNGIYTNVDIIVNNKYIIIPPSIHPETGQPYIWLGPSLEDAYDDLEILTATHLEKITNFYNNFKTRPSSSVSLTSPTKTKLDLSIIVTSPDGIRCPHGSHDRLKALTTGFIDEGKPFIEAINSLLYYDKKHHLGITFFGDKRAGTDFGADNVSNAIKFYANILKTVNENRLKRGLKPQLPMEFLPELKTDPVIAERTQQNFIPFPEHSGIIKNFIDLCDQRFKESHEPLALAGALSLMAVYASNRYVIDLPDGNVCTPNFYTLALARSGSGKDIPYSIINKCLKDTHLKGCGSYRSGSAMIEDLPRQQERLDLIDEGSTLIRMMNADNKNQWEREVCEVQMALFSRAKDSFLGIKSKKDGNLGASYNPMVSCFVTTTPKGFTQSADPSMAQKGLFPRYVTFYSPGEGDYRSISKRHSTEFKKQLEHFVSDFKSLLKRTPKRPKKAYLVDSQNLTPNDSSFQGIEYNPIRLKLSNEAVLRYAEYDRSTFERDSKDKSDESFERAFSSRFLEIACKIALFHSLSNAHDKEISLASLNYGIEIVETAFNNSLHLFLETNAETQLEKSSQKVLNIIKQTPGINRRGITRATRFLTGKQRDAILENLQDGGFISVDEVPTSDGKNKKTVYKIV